MPARVNGTLQPLATFLVRSLCSIRFENLFVMLFATINGFFFIMFESANAMDEVIDGRPWLFHGQPLVLQRWEPGMALRQHSHTQVPVWIKLRHLPIEYWIEDGLSIVASGIGRPLYPDAIRKACTRLDFARVCIMLDFSSTLPKHIVVMAPKEDGSESPCRVDVEYEWILNKCTTCCSLGHSTPHCPSTRKPRQPPVKVFVQKPLGQKTAPPLMNPDEMHNKDKEVPLACTEPSTAVETVPSPPVDEGLDNDTIGKGKEVHLCYLMMMIQLNGVLNLAAPRVVLNDTCCCLECAWSQSPRPSSSATCFDF
ncbi:UNVERIFIED_CONTAM: hypothetical protein Slati_2468500 [Sesamum latifolium]|uniref:DUF4283 domain-containing protein n=1 Tax=Sesamum latifolium TaxID=2727402 RepID=A0AAW2WDJ2_9LAMI